MLTFTHMQYRMKSLNSLLCLLFLLATPSSTKRMLFHKPNISVEVANVILTYTEHHCGMACDSRPLCISATWSRQNSQCRFYAELVDENNAQSMKDLIWFDQLDSLGMYSVVHNGWRNYDFDKNCDYIKTKRLTINLKTLKYRAYIDPVVYVYL